MTTLSHTRSMLSIIVLAALLSSFVLGAGSPALGEDWPHWRGPARDGRSTETNWRHDWVKTPPKVLWKASIGTGFSSIAVASGRAFTMGYSDGEDSVFCFDATTGKKLWEHKYRCRLVDNLHEGGPAATPTVDGEFVYTLSKQGHLFCFKAASGKVIWSLELEKLLGVRMPEWGFSSSVLIHGEQAIVDAGPLAAFRKSDGKLIWKTKKYTCGYGSPIPFESADKKVWIANLNNDGLILADPKSGEVPDLFPWKTSFRTNSSTPVLIDKDLFISTGYNRGCARVQFTENSFAKSFENRDMRNHMNVCVYIDGYLYGIDGNSNRARRLLRLVCMDAKTGKVQWSEAGFGCGSLIAAGDRLIILGDRGTLAVAKASPTKFEELGRTAALDGRCWTSPVIANGRVYCRDAKGNLVCLDVSK